MSGETRVRPGSLKHGTYECCVGTQDIPGCDCKPCTKAWRQRIEERKDFAYYRNNSRATTQFGSKPHRRRSNPYDYQPPVKQGRPILNIRDRKHPGLQTYNKGCRCVPCVDLMSRYRRERAFT